MVRMLPKNKTKILGKKGKTNFHSTLILHCENLGTKRNLGTDERKELLQVTEERERSNSLYAAIAFICHCQESTFLPRDHLLELLPLLFCFAVQVCSCHHENTSHSTTPTKKPAEAALEPTKTFVQVFEINHLSNSVYQTSR